MAPEEPFDRGVPGDPWDARLAQLDGHILQSSAWCHFAKSQGDLPVHAEGAGWMWSAALRGAGPFRYLYSPCGPTASDAASMASALESMRRAGRSLRCDFLRVEPLALAAHPPGMRRVRSRQPETTWRLNLTAAEEELKRGLTKGHRGSVNSAARKGLEITNGDDVEEFLRLLHLTESRARIETHADAYFRDMVTALGPGHLSLYFVAKDGRNVATAMAFHFGGTTYYAHAGADPEVRSLSPAAPLVWRMILDARARGDRWFDFWGVTTSTDPGHPWAGFSQFKRSFGGELQERAGTFDIVLRPLRYRAYQLAHLVHR